MTDRLKGCTVVFDADYREDDAERILDAIAMVKGVKAVSPSLASGDDWMNRTRIEMEMEDKLRAAFARKRQGGETP